MKYLEDLEDFLQKISNFSLKMEKGEIDRSFSKLRSLPQIRLPYSTQSLNIYHAYKLIEKFFILIQERDDFVLIIYNSDKRLILESVLIEIGGEGFHIRDVISDAIPEDFILEGEDSHVFQNVAKFVQQKYSIQIGSMKVFDSEFLDEFRNITKNRSEITDDTFSIEETFRLLGEGYNQNRIKIHPELPCMTLLKRIIALIPRSIEIESLLREYHNNLNIGVTFFDDDWYISFVRKNNTITVSEPFEFEKITIKDHYQWKNFTKEFQKKYHGKYQTNPNYFINIDWCLEFFADLCESEFPLSKSRFEFLLQRFLYFVKQNEEFWDVVPRPIIYNGYIRLFTRILGGFHINPRKVSYWSVPSQLTQFFKENFAPNDQIILMLTKDKRIKDALKIKLKQSAIGEISYFNGKELQISANSDKDRYDNIVNQLGFTKTIAFLEKSLVKQIIRFIIVDRNSKNPLKFISFLFLLKKLNREKFFRCYPVLPWYTFFKKTGAIRSFRKINRLLYDFLEF